MQPARRLRCRSPAAPRWGCSSRRGACRRCRRTSSSTAIAPNSRRSMPRCHCSAYGVSFSNEWPSTRGLAAWSSAVVRGLTCTIGGNGLSIVRDGGEVGRVGLGVDVLRDRVRHLLPDHVRRRRLLREVGDAVAGAQDRARVAEQVVGQPEPRREVAVARLLVDRGAGAVLAGVDQPQVRPDRS